jgi:hypothetical protein
MQAYCANSVACHSRGLRLESDSREPLVGTIDGTVKRVGSTALPGARNEYGSLIPDLTFSDVAPPTNHSISRTYLSHRLFVPCSR